jgi:hypothetical protein
LHYNIDEERCRQLNTKAFFAKIRLPLQTRHFYFQNKEIQNKFLKIKTLISQIGLDPWLNFRGILDWRRDATRDGKSARGWSALEAAAESSRNTVGRRKSRVAVALPLAVANTMAAAAVFARGNFH